MLLIDGRPVIVNRDRTDWNQGTLLKYAVTGKRLILAELRVNAGANTTNLTISPEGGFVGVVSGGGWRSPANPTQGGYNIPVFAAADFKKVQGVFGPRPIRWAARSTR